MARRVRANIVLFRRGTYRHVASWDTGRSAPGAARLAAGASLTSWSGATLAGRLSHKPELTSARYTSGHRARGLGMVQTGVSESSCSGSATRRDWPLRAAALEPSLA